MFFILKIKLVMIGVLLLIEFGFVLFGLLVNNKKCVVLCFVFFMDFLRVFRL